MLLGVRIITRLLLSVRRLRVAISRHISPRGRNEQLLPLLKNERIGQAIGCGNGVDAAAVLHRNPEQVFTRLDHVKAFVAARDIRLLVSRLLLISSRRLLFVNRGLLSVRVVSGLTIGGGRVPVAGHAQDFTDPDGFIDQTVVVHNGFDTGTKALRDAEQGITWPDGVSRTGSISRRGIVITEGRAGRRGSSHGTTGGQFFGSRRINNQGLDRICLFLNCQISSGRLSVSNRDFFNDRCFIVDDRCFITSFSHCVGVRG